MTLLVNDLVKSAIAARRLASFASERRESTDEYKVAVTFLLLDILRTTSPGELIEDETNRRIMEALFALGLESSPIPLYLREKISNDKR